MLEHTYASTGTYQITIKSDTTSKQITNSAVYKSFWNKTDI